MPAVPKPTHTKKPASRLIPKEITYKLRECRFKPHRNKDPLPQSVVEEVFTRDKGVCQGCGRNLGVVTPASTKNLLHHITLKSRFRKYPTVFNWIVNDYVPWWFEKHSKENLITLCWRCHHDCHNGRETVENQQKHEKWRDRLYASNRI